MAQFVVIWSIFLYASCLALSTADIIVQQATKVPVVNNNVDGVGVGVHVGVGGEGGEVGVSGVGSDKKEERIYHPAAVTKPRVIEQYDHRSLDGHYEYRYLLSNGDARYERAYWVPVGKSMVLARKGYYSYPLPNSKFLTVFYTADQNGYRQDSTTYSRSQPTLPRSIEVPEYVATPAHATYVPVTQRPTSPHVYISTTTRRPSIQPTGNPFIQLYPSSVPQASVHHPGIVNPAHPSYSHQSQVKPIHSSVGGHFSSGAHSSSGGHYPSGTNSAPGVHSPAGAHPQVGVHFSSAVPSSSTVHSSSAVHHSPSVVHTSLGVQSGIPSGVSSSSNIHSSSGIHPASGAYSQAGVHGASTVHSPSIVHTSLGVHSSSSSGAHSAVGHHSTVRPSTQVYPSHQHQSSAHVPTIHSPTGVHPTAASTSVPVQTWHYNF
ncbi:uncharacterized protein LOC128858403 [Anastrepha ludens]|uniref:uncharacterized protein LOC128858403 n=1 Tax=Anastrepha ludens TaxID=28586 RepID=UPI0023AEF382|nr:uncharacterized protein LOC128858403 [Anastrepha ludens]